jgi:hypothetical protein
MAMAVRQKQLKALPAIDKSCAFLQWHPMIGADVDAG